MNESMVRKGYIIIGGQEFQDHCPLDCPEREEPFYQGNMCSRCPIFNCTPPAGDPDFIMMEPDEYRKDWAVEWKKWFNRGMKGGVNLELHFEKE